jgi:hypothetical protein
MKKWLISSMLACALATAGSAQGECVTLAEARPGAPCVIMQRDGQRGAWIVQTRLNDLTLAYAKAPDLEAQIERYRSLTAVQTAESSYWHEAALDRAKQAAEAQVVAAHAGQVAEQFATELSAEKAKADSVWRSPWLWLSVGVALGGGAVTALAIAVR